MKVNNKQKQGTPLTRRALLSGAGALGGAAILPAAVIAEQRAVSAEQRATTGAAEAPTVEAHTDTGLVRTTTGQIAGFRRNGIFTYKGIPYAASTEGEARFAAPRPAPAWSGIRSSRSWGPLCPQPNRGDGRSNDEETFLFDWEDATARSEIAFVFHNTDRCDTMTGGGARPRALADKVSGAWLQFARNGDPNGPGLPRIYDRQGFQRFSGPGLEKLNTALPNDRRQRRLHTESAFLFSDLNQWMLKVLLAPSIPQNLLRAPRQPFRRSSELAIAADVSAMSASRFVRQLRREGFLEEDSAHLRLVRVETLLKRWQAAYSRTPSELPLRWIVQNKSQRQLLSALHSYLSSARSHRSRLQICLGLFAAAETLGFGFVHGVPNYLYVDSLDRERLRQLGLSPENAEHAPDVYARIPTFRSSVFRGAVERDGVPVTDALQIWLDVGSHPARGPEQASPIFTHVLEPLWKGSR